MIYLSLFFSYNYQVDVVCDETTFASTMPIIGVDGKVLTVIALHAWGL
jgi:hypothetical protein